MDSGRLETVPNGAVHLDTVRALHQTVVSLRTALEVSKNELKALKDKYERHSQCTEYADVIEKLTIENHILRRKIIDSSCVGRESPAQNINLQVTYSPRLKSGLDFGEEVVIQTATTDVQETFEAEDSFEEEGSPEETETEAQPDNLDTFCSTDNLNQGEVSLVEAASHDSPEVNVSTEISPHNNTEIEEIPSQLSHPKDSTSSHQPSFKTKLELLSKFDVRIKVRSLKEGTVISSTTSESGSTTTEENKEKGSKDTAQFEFEEKREHFENTEGPFSKVNLKSVSTENIKMAVPNESDAKSNVDKFNVQVRITSEENLVVKENVERSRRKDTLNLDVDDLSLRSLSEGDNSVFSEGVVTPVEPPAGDDRQEAENASGNESEEVDDIELIFTTDESKDMSNLQEDLVSIRETDHWTPGSASTTHSTPVLIKFHTLDPDFQPGGETSDNAENENHENSTLQNVIAESTLKKRVSLPSDKDIRHVAFNGKGSLDLPGRGILKSCDNKSDNMLYKRSLTTSNRRLDSVDSLTCEYNRGLSFDNTKSSSFELGSSMDILHRDESIDNFHKAGHLGHRFSVFAETDISKCGISEEDLAGNLNVRRNTCPNPFQYRAPFRGLGRGLPLRPTSRTRPVLRESSAVRRDSAAQTLLSALPPRWSSDGHLAHQMPLSSIAPTLPQRVPAPSGNTATSRRLTVPNARPPTLAEDERRVLLSDIGFTSMVPELSRSADPVWALANRSSLANSPVATSTSKFISRGSSYRSPSLSLDRSNDWIPQSVYIPPARMEYRSWRSSLPDVRRDDTEELLLEAERFVRGSIENVRAASLDLEAGFNVGLCPVSSVGHQLGSGPPYIPSEPRQLRLGHTVKLISQGRVVVGRVRYVGLAGGSAASSGVVVGAECPTLGIGRDRNDGTFRGRRYFLAAPQCTAVFVPFNKIVMAWPN